MMLDLVYIKDLDDYGLYIETSSEKDRHILYAGSIICEYYSEDFVKVDDTFKLIYDGYKGLGNGVETKLHHAYDNS